MSRPIHGGYFAPWLTPEDYSQEIALAKLQGKFVTWHLIDVTRRATKPSQKIVSYAKELDPDRSGEDDTLGKVILREEIHELLNGLAGLSERQRSCLLQAVNGDGYEAIAQDQGLTRKQVDNAVAGARRALAR